jgi:ORF6N domain-containing protein
MTKSLVKLPIERVENVILIIRGEKVILDTHLAGERFPDDFMFQLTGQEFEALRSHFVISKGRGGRRHLPYAFTEHGAIMAANVLNSKRAVQASVQVVRAFVKLREMLVSNAELADKLNELEKKYDQQFKDRLRCHSRPHDTATCELEADWLPTQGPKKVA